MNDAEPIPALPPASGATDRVPSPQLDRKLTPPPPAPAPVTAAALPHPPPEEREDRTKANSVGERDAGVNNGGCDNDGDGDGDGDGASSQKADSEAETIIQPGRDEASPEKKKKIIKHERETSEERASNLDRMDVDASSPGEERPRKRKRMENDPRDSKSPDPRHRRARSPRSAGLEVSKLRKSEDLESSSARRSSHQSLPAKSETGNGNVLRKRSSSEGLVERDPKSQRVSEQQRQHREDLPKPKKRIDKNTGLRRQPSIGRSVSPALSSRERDTPVSTGPGDAAKKKRVPTPLITNHQRHSSEDRRSVSSSVSDSPLPTGRSRKPTSNEYTPTSPAKQMQHKKRRDQNGRTPLARACAAQEVDSAKARLQERPEDLNIPDNAGNTPLQIAALMGCAPIVKILINAGCEIDTKNIDKDTPLIDAVENGHLDVVKILLDAGASPRVVNAQGDEPYELIPTDNPNYEALRKLISNVKASDIRRRRSDDQTRRGSSAAKDPSSRAASAQSPRDLSPMTGARSPPPASMVSRRRTVRSEATRNDLLWTKPTPENLRDFAAKGDMAGVAIILNVGHKADSESLIAAAKGGHDEVLGLLLGMGDPDPDPEPLRSGSHRAGYNTPMLAAIGKGNLAIIQLLLDQRGFNPTRRDHRGRTYYEISRERRGDHWTKEFDLLREAYESYASKVRKMRKPESKAPRKPRDNDKETKRPERRESSSPPPHPQRRVARSPVSNRHQDNHPREREPVREKKREGLAQGKDRLGSVPTGPRGKVQDRDGNNSEHSTNTDLDSKHPRSKGPVPGKGQSESAASNQGEEVVKRRRLIAGRPPQDGNRRRGSLISSDSLSGREEISKPRLQQRPSNDAKGLKPGGPSLKRSRSSVTPDRSRSRGPDSRHDSQGGVQKKRQRVRSVDSMSKAANGDPRKNHDSSADQPSKAAQKRRSDSIPAKPDRVKTQSSGNANASKDSSSGKGGVTSSESSSIKQEQKKGTAMNTIPVATAASQQAKQREGKDSEKKDSEKKPAGMDSERAKSSKGAKDVKDKEGKSAPSEAEQARLTKEAEEKKAAAEAERAKAAKEAKEAKLAKEAKEAKEAEEKRIAEEAEREKAAKEAKEAEEKRIADEAERAKAAKEAKEAREAREEEERRAAAEAEQAKAAKEAEEAREAAERAARLAREKVEEEERKRKEAEQRRIKQAEDERQKRIEQERQRQARLRKEQEEQEQRRRDALPNRLRVAANLVGSSDPKAKDHAWLKKFLPLLTATTRQIEPECDAEVESEKWIANYVVAPLLATNDLQLSQYTSWEKKPATPTQRNNLWRVTRRILVQADEQDFHRSTYQDIMKMDMETRPKYFAMEHVFWVRLSDFMDLVPHIPHLHGLPIQEMKMHVDPEPSSDSPSQQLNGHNAGSPASDYEPRSSLPNGLGINGINHP
ncbi:Set3 complex subunit [Arachnomyces sp. PD_36]|nr:Set3 complex subunit [Arachnomyces sp. PD_36]